MPRTLLLVLLCLALCAPASALAQAEDSAEAHYQSAARLFGEGRYREALEEFDAAIAIAPEPIFYCNRAVVLIKLRELDAALQSMQTCRDTFRGEERELAQIDAQLQALTIFVRNLQRHASSTATTIATRPAAQPPKKEGWSSADTGFITLGVGAALLGSAATLDLLSADLVQDYKDAATGPDRQRYQQTRDDLEQRQRIFWGLTIGGSILAATGAGLVLYHFFSTDDEGDAPVTITPIITPDTAGVLFDLRF